MITFETYAEESYTIQIGGSDSLSVGDNVSGSVGPFPRYSIQRENISTGNSTYINSKYNVTVSGTATIKSTDSNQNITQKGQRQHRIQGEALLMLKIGRDIAKAHSAGRLKIAPYGGLSNIITFNNAKLISIDLPEQTEESAGVQSLEFSFVFEAYDEVSTVINSGNFTSNNPTYHLSSAEETWDLTVNESEFTLEDSDGAKDVYKTFTLTHTVSATGLNKYNTPNDPLQKDGEAFRQAAQWVASRLVDDPISKVTSDINGSKVLFPSEFYPANMNRPTKHSEFGYNLAEEGGGDRYNATNHVRNINHDFSAGSYTVTDTWLLAPGDFFCTHEIEVNVESSEDQPYTNVTVSATFNGLSTDAGPSSKKTNSYENALLSFNQFKPTAYALASSAYSRVGIGGSLNSESISESVGQNKTNGVITYTVAFNDRETKIPGAISESVNVTYSNQYGLVDVYAVIQILGKSDGPIIQDFGTTPIFKTDITVDITMKKGYGKPDGTILSLSNRPGGNPRCASFSESWNPITRAYNLSESWERIPQ